MTIGKWIARFQCWGKSRSESGRLARWVIVDNRPVIEVKQLWGSSIKDTKMAFSMGVSSIKMIRGRIKTVSKNGSFVHIDGSISKGFGDDLAPYIPWVLVSLCFISASRNCTSCGRLSRPSYRRSMVQPRKAVVIPQTYWKHILLLSTQPPQGWLYSCSVDVMAMLVWTRARSVSKS